MPAIILLNYLVTQYTPYNIYQSYQQYIQLTRHSPRFHTKHTKITFKNSRRRYKCIVIFAQRQPSLTHDTMHTIEFNQSYQQYIQLTRHSIRFHTKHTKITFKNSRRRHKRIVIFAQKQPSLTQLLLAQYT